MRVYLVIISSILLSGVLSGQLPTRAYFTDGQTNVRKDFKYDERDNIIELTVSLKNEEGAYYPNSRETWARSDGRMESYSYATWSEHKGRFEDSYSVDIKFNSNTCPSEVIVQRRAGDFLIDSFSASVVSNYDCDIYWRDETPDGPIRWNRSVEIVRTRTSNVEHEQHYWLDLNGDKQKGVEREWTYNERNQLTKYFHTTSDIAEANRDHYGYDSKGRIKQITLYRKEHRGDLYLYSKSKYTYEEKDSLAIKRRGSYESYDNDGNLIGFTHDEERYEYYCDGLLKRKEVLDAQGNIKNIERYEYEKGHRCKNTSKEMIRVYPNPTCGWITIEGEKLSLQGTEIRILNPRGELVYVEKINERLQIKNLWIGDYRNQLLFIELINGTNRNVQRVFVK